jgi:hypothetical protein
MELSSSRRERRRRSGMGTEVARFFPRTLEGRKRTGLRPSLGRPLPRREAEPWPHSATRDGHALGVQPERPGAKGAI